MTQIIRDDKLGQLVIDKVYFYFDREVQFKCHWSNTPDTVYVALLVEEYESNKYDETSNEYVSNYYIAQVNGAIISDLESKNYTLKEVFDSRPLTWISHRFSLGGDKQSTIVKSHCRINPSYLLPEGTTLCI